MFYFTIFDWVTIMGTLYFTVLLGVYLWIYISFAIRKKKYFRINWYHFAANLLFFLLIWILLFLSWEANYNYESFFHKRQDAESSVIQIVYVIVSPVVIMLIWNLYILFAQKYFYVIVEEKRIILALKIIKLSDDFRVGGNLCYLNDKKILRFWFKTRFVRFIRERVEKKNETIL
jgi:magnesium-transporting ATPase (P-type)